ncbi:MAG: PHP domain-containing protein [Thermoprotei archaeon]
MLVKADMHIHSSFSDGRASPREILLYAISKGLSVISITDHDTFAGSVEARKYAKNFEEKIVVIIGIELRVPQGDVLLYCYEPIETPRDLSVLIDYAHENNCLVVPAHPFDLLRLGIGDAIFEYKGWDAIEVWNASASKGANKKAIEAAKILDLPMLANSDAHIPEYIGVAYTMLEISELSIDGVFKAIKNNRVKPHYGYPPFRVFLKRIAWGIERIATKLLEK